MATVFLLVGLPAAGKTTTARRLAEQHAALRMTPDEWMIPLFGESEANGRRDVIEARLISLATQAVRVGTDVVLDFGCWARDERDALRSVFEQLGASYEVVYLPIEPAEQQRRIEGRWSESASETFPISSAELQTWRRIFEAPDDDELTGDRRREPPAPWASWLGWAQDRWPSLSIE